MRTVIWQVPTLVDAADEAEVRRLLDQIHGVALLAVDRSTRLITVEYDPDAADLAEIAAVLATAGYPVARPRPSV